MGSFKYLKWENANNEHEILRDVHLAIAKCNEYSVAGFGCLTFRAKDVSLPGESASQQCFLDLVATVL